MTFSLVARCPRSGQIGVAAATAMPAVGKLLTHARAGLGAVATQARLNPYLGIDGLRHLAAGLTAAEVVERLCRDDPRIATRQMAVVDAAGRTSAWTGPDCPDWAGSLAGEGFSVQGNRLAGPHVLEAMAAAFLADRALPLAERFLAALEAGVESGGDTKGEQSATIYIMDTEEYPLWDIRVDQHERPVVELHRLHDIFRDQLLPHIKKMPTRANPAGEAGEDDA
ncbi:DUF1028 domain-containing protein [Caenispirillum bisanense]|uniref:DUF1028 domain-containing protein n=1 Tax=Caenispirillum bisanense TaxID=414052 RepID=UPI0031D2ACB6